MAARSLEGLRLRMAEAPRVIDRGEILANARHALTLTGGSSSSCDGKSLRAADTSFLNWQ